MWVGVSFFVFVVGCSSASNGAAAGGDGGSEVGADVGADAADSGGQDAADASSATGTADGFKQAKWGSNVTVAYGDCFLEYKSDGLPNHARDAEYALPNPGVMVPSATTASAGADPTKAQTYDFKINTCPTKAATPTSASLGTIGVMISGAALFNPYEGDGKTVALASNFSVKDSSGKDVWFLDSCNGHPNPMGAYHYHGLPPCVSAEVDVASGPSHILGIAFDGYPIYGNRDVDGKEVTVAQLDACNGITSPTPEFPKGVYHYVLLDKPDSSSSIKCFTGVVDPSLTSMGPGGPGKMGMGVWSGPVLAKWQGASICRSPVLPPAAPANLISRPSL